MTEKEMKISVLEKEFEELTKGIKNTYQSVDNLNDDLTLLKKDPKNHKKVQKKKLKHMNSVLQDMGSNLDNFSMDICKIIKELQDKMKEIEEDEEDDEEKEDHENSDSDDNDSKVTQILDANSDNLDNPWKDGDVDDEIFDKESKGGGIDVMLPTDPWLIPLQPESSYFNDGVFKKFIDVNEPIGKVRTLEIENIEDKPSIMEDVIPTTRPKWVSFRVSEQCGVCSTKFNKFGRRVSFISFSF